LLELAVDAAKKRASLGEISYACEKVVGRYKAVIRTVSGVYSSVGIQSCVYFGLITFGFQFFQTGDLSFTNCSIINFKKKSCRTL